MNEIRSRQTAINEGYRHYFTGKACKHGHIARRYTTTNGCTECVKVGSTELRKRQNARLMMIGRAGTVTLSITVHECNVKQVTEYIRALNEATVLMMPARIPAAPAAPVVQEGVDWSYHS